MKLTRRRVPWRSLVFARGEYGQDFRLLKTNTFSKCPPPRARTEPSGMTLIEVVIALAITGLAVGGIITGYTFCTTSAEKASLSLVAHARAMERLEEVRSAKWDLSSWPTVDQVVVTNFPKKAVTLDRSGAGVATAPATILTEIWLASTNPPLKSIRVNCIWSFKGVQITNTIETCRAPDQ